METIKSYTDISQSKKLAEILPFESADFCYIKTGVTRDNRMGIPEYQFKPMPHKDYSGESIGCWSLAALLGVLIYPHIEQNYMGKWVCRVEQQDTTYLWEDSNPVDACYEMILKLKENELI